MTTALATTETRSMATVHELGVEDVLAQIQKIQRVMKEAMKPGEHYGVIPGTGDKPSLLKAGAEKLCLMFRLDPEYAVTETYDGGHLTIVSTCTLYHIPTGNRMGSGMGSCSTKESRYAYRKASRECPACGLDTIIKGREQFGGGWVCFKKLGGCGAKYPDNDAKIVNQPTGRVVNPDLADQHNTVLKMGNKRSLIAAVLNVTAASDIFTQDLEDTPVPPVEKPVEKPVERQEKTEAAPPQDPSAPAKDWLDALKATQSKKALEHLKAGLRKEWPTFSKLDQDALYAEVEAQEERWSRGAA